MNRVHQVTRGISLAIVTAGMLVAQAQPPLPVDNLPEGIFSHAMPLGLPAHLPAPEENPFTEASFQLGRRLFFDPILSANRTVSCASCHDPDHGFSSREALPLGVFGRHALRHAPTLFNRGFGSRQRWDGATPTLEQQVVLPIEDPNEMDLKLTDAVQRLSDDARYSDAFQQTYGESPSPGSLSRALSTFVRGLVTGDTPVDHFQAGNSSALSAEEKAGLWIYESKGQCWQCHSGPNFTDEDLHNTGVGAATEGGKNPQDRRFKTPTLRRLADTAPYMHDGSLASLEDVVEFYAKGGQHNPGLDRRIRPLDLSGSDRKHLVAFLTALSRRHDKN